MSESKISQGNEFACFITFAFPKLHRFMQVEITCVVLEKSVPTKMDKKQKLYQVAKNLYLSKIAIDTTISSKIFKLLLLLERKVV